MERELTTDAVLAFWRKRPAVYYALSEHLPRGRVFEVAATEFGPDFWVLHPDDLPTLRTALPAVRFVPLRDWRPGEPGEVPDA